jgi:hypothetical protein
MDDKNVVYFGNGFSYKHETARKKFKVSRNLMYQPRMGLRSLGEETSISTSSLADSDHGVLVQTAP